MSRAAPQLDPALLVLVVTGVMADEPPAGRPAGFAGGRGGRRRSPCGGRCGWAAGGERLAHDQQYADAIKALDAAIDRHKTRRFTLLGKAQNPDSDPTEEIFLRSGEQLKDYWGLLAKLKATTLPLAMGDKVDADALVKDLNALQKVRENLAAKADPADAVVTAAKDAADRAKKLQDVGAALTGKPDASADDILTAAKDDGGQGRRPPGRGHGPDQEAGRLRRRHRDGRRRTPLKKMETLQARTRGPGRQAGGRRRGGGEQGQGCRENDPGRADGPRRQEGRRRRRAADRGDRGEGRRGRFEGHCRYAENGEIFISGGRRSDKAAAVAVKALTTDKDVAKVEERVRDLKEKAAMRGIPGILEEEDGRGDRRSHDGTECTEGRKDRPANEAGEPAFAAGAAAALAAAARKDPAATDLAEKAVVDADRILKDDESSADDKARAHAVKGIALRDQKDYAGARRTS